MKIKPIERLCKARRELITIKGISESGEVLSVWLGDGRGCYRLDGTPPMTSEDFLGIFDVSAADRDAWSVEDKLTDKPVFGGDAAGDDVLLETMEGGVIIDGESFSPVQDSSGGVRWIPDSYLKPLKKVPELSFRLRSLGGSESVCAMSGLLLVAVISPQLTEFEERVMQDIRRAIGASDMEKW